ncbi:ornithine cyclodeaminase family protein [Streptosporangium sp. NPDC006013]|uniref:ornithine cyclodeaminase family protein n=1 Tax=Streptosporangium sp. NPDC006013 TaxID=3155596 RepID=UPI0033AD09EE
MKTASAQATVEAPRHWTDAEVAEHITLAETVEAVRQALVDAHRGRIEQPQRLALGDGRLLVMAARASGAVGDAVVKTVNVSAHAGEVAEGVHGIVLSLDGETGRVTTAEASALTVLRTAALVALATEVLAPPRVHTLAVLGAGRQARGQVAAVALVRRPSTVRIWNRTRERAAAFAEDLAATMPEVHVEVADTADQAVGGADVVCCATASTDALFEASALSPQVHVNAIGAYRPDMHEIPQEAMAVADLVVADDVAACLVESGEIIDAVVSGAVDASRLRSLGEVLIDPPTRRGVTVFKSVGIAAADYAAARLLHRPRS